MTELWSVLLPILLADVVNPVLFAFMVFAAGSARPVITPCAVLLGHTLAYFSAGLILGTGVEWFTQRLQNPQTIDFIIGGIVGVLLLGVGLASVCAPAQESSKPEQAQEMGPLRALLMGAVVNFIGIPFALPYFAALDQMLKADLGDAQSITVLLGYNLLYAAPFLLVPLLVLLLGERSRPLLQRINRVLEKISAVLMPVLLFLLGGALCWDAVEYFRTGKGLF